MTRVASSRRTRKRLRRSSRPVRLARLEQRRRRARVRRRRRRSLETWRSRVSTPTLSRRAAAVLREKSRARRVRELRGQVPQRREPRPPFRALRADGRGAHARSAAREGEVEASHKKKREVPAHERAARRVADLGALGVGRRRERGDERGSPRTTRSAEARVHGGSEKRRRRRRSARSPASRAAASPRGRLPPGGRRRLARARARAASQAPRRRPGTPRPSAAPRRAPAPRGSIWNNRQYSSPNVCVPSPVVKALYHRCASTPISFWYCATRRALTTRRAVSSMASRSIWSVLEVSAGGVSTRGEADLGCDSDVTFGNGVGVPECTPHPSGARG